MKSPPTASRLRWITGLLMLFLSGTLAYVAMMEEAEQAIDLSKEQAPFPSMKLPLKEVEYGPFGIAVAGPSGGSYGGTFIMVTDAGGGEYHFELVDRGLAAGSPYQEVRWNDAPMADQPRAKAVCLYLLKQHHDPVPDEYYTLSGKKPPSPLVRKIRSLLK